MYLDDAENPESEELAKVWMQRAYDLDPEEVDNLENILDD